MKRLIALTKFVVLVTSLALLGTYIWYRTGGPASAFSAGSQPRTVPSDLPVMGGSKSAPIYNP